MAKFYLGPAVRCPRISFCLATYQLIWGQILLASTSLNACFTFVSHFYTLGRFSPFVIISSFSRIYFRGFLAILYNCNLYLKVNVSIEEYNTNSNHFPSSNQRNQPFSHCHLPSLASGLLLLFPATTSTWRAVQAGASKNDGRDRNPKERQWEYNLSGLLYQFGSMGGRNSNPTRKVKHFFFGDVVKKKSFNKEVIVVTHPIINNQQFDDWKQKYDLVHNMNKQYLFVPQGLQFRKIQYSVPTCGGCCGAQSQYEMTYENVDFALSSEIMNRKQLKKMYSEPELTKMLYNLVQGAKQFQKRNTSVGDIRTKNILITKDSEVKMVNIASFPSERTSVQKVLEGFDHTTIFYFAPEEVEYVRSRSAVKSDFPNPKTEAWSIGLCLLEAATLDCSEQIYEMPSRKINQITLNKRLKKVQENYPTFFEFLVKIVKMNSQQRMTTGECWACLRPYSQKIAQLEAFKRNPTAENTSIRKYQTEGSSKF